MVFDFLKYIRPVWYFNLKPIKDFCYFPNKEDLVEAGLEILEDKNYTSSKSIQLDLAWRAFNLGFICTKEKAGLNVWVEAKLPVVDNYRFLRKNFSKAWVYYVLVLRLLSFKNPYKELKAFIKTRNVSRESFLKDHIKYEGFLSFDSKLVRSNPLVSVIIPTLNRYEYLSGVLEDLEKQNYKNFEVLVVDQSEPFNEAFYKTYDLDISASYQKEKALWLARNSAIKQSKGDYILLMDDDSRFDANWIENHLKCLDFFNSDISSGVSISKRGDKVPEHYSYFRISDQLDTGNALVKKAIFKDIGLFDRQFEKQRMGDGEFGLRAYLNGFLNVSNPYAKRLHLKVEKGGLREMGSWDAFRNQKLFQPRPIPSVLYLFRKYFGNKNAKMALLKTVPASTISYRFKKNKALQIVGAFISLIILPIILYQVQKSWRLSSAKLKQGELIENLV